MKQSIIYTVSGHLESELPTISNKNMSDKGICVVLSAALLKEIKGINPGPVITERFWKEISSNDELYFDRTLIRGEIKSFFDECLKGNIALDIIYLKQIYEKIKNVNNWIKIKEEVIKNDLLITIISNITQNSEYCYLIQEIKQKVHLYLSSKIKSNQKKILTTDEYLRLENLLEIDFELIYQFIEKMEINKKSKKEIYDEISLILEDSDINVQQDINDLLENEFITLFLSDKKRVFEVNKDISIKMLKEFFNKDNTTNKPFLIIGSSGSGKSILGLKLCQSAVKEDYFVKFINLEKYANNSNIQNLKYEIENSSNKNKMFIYFDNVNCLFLNKTKSSFIELLKIIINVKENVIVISSDDDSVDSNSFLNNNALIKLSNQLNIDPLVASEKEWIKTPLEYTIYKKIKTNVTNRGALYYLYINKIFEDQISNQEYSLFNFKKDLQKIAYYSTIKMIKFDDLKKYEINHKIESFLKSNKIVSIDNKNFGYIKFSNNLIRDFLSASYIINFTEEKLMNTMKDQDFYSYKWFETMIFIAEWLNNSIVDVYKPLLTVILYHLRIKKDIDRVDEIISLIKDSEYKNLQIRYSCFKKSEAFYFERKYFDSIINSVKSLSKITNYSINNHISKIYNLICSCTNELYLPKISLKLNSIGFIYSNQSEKVQLLENKGKSYLKMGDFENSYNCFFLKRKLNIMVNNSESLKDEIDLLFLESIKYIDNQIYESKLVYLHNRFKEIILSYESKEDELEIDNSENKMYVYKSFSYILPKIVNNSLEKEIFNFINEYKKLSAKEQIFLGICLFNTARYFYKTGDANTSFNYFNQSLEIFKIYQHKSKIYQILLYMFLITKVYRYYDEAMNIYDIIKNESLKSIDEINSQSLILSSFGIEFKRDNYILPRIKKDEELEFNLDSLLVF